MHKFLIAPFFFMILATVIVTTAFTQEVQRVTYTDIATGTKRAVNAIFAGYQQERYHEVRENGRLRVEKYVSYKFFNGDWSAYDYAGSTPLPNPAYRNLSEFEMVSLQMWTYEKDSGGITPLQDMTVLTMFAVPAGQGTPFWWSRDTKYWYAFRKVYIIAG
ncbi:hypothetical protein AGMMS49944_01910 [Spirochaetia bacterium]|nr:hypothetical protein AGMMS49944_01910 [Spirochaetia bacterium]